MQNINAVFPFLAAKKHLFKWRHYFNAIFSILKTNAIFKILRQNWPANTNILNTYWFLKMLLFTWLWTYLDLARHWLRGGGAKNAPCRIFAIAQRLTERSTWNSEYLPRHQFYTVRKIFVRFPRILFSSCQFGDVTTRQFWPKRGTTSNSCIGVGTGGQRGQLPLQLWERRGNAPQLWLKNGL